MRAHTDRKTGYVKTEGKVLLWEEEAISCVSEMIAQRDENWETPRSRYRGVDYTSLMKEKLVQDLRTRRKNKTENQT